MDTIFENTDSLAGLFELAENNETNQFFLHLSRQVKEYLSEDGDSGWSLYEIVGHSLQVPFCRRFFDRFREKPFREQVLLLILVSHFQQRGPLPWQIPSQISDERQEVLREEAGHLLSDGTIISLPDEREPERRAGGSIPLMLSLDVASYLFDGLDDYINFGESLSSCGQLVLAENIPPKNLHYDIEIKERVQRLEKAISPGGYETAMARLAEHGFQKKLTVMIYGVPGTGKTELVWQLARRSGRNVIAADIAKLTSCYVGEAERNYRSLFNSYRYAARIMKTVPILLLNEADCFLNNRMSVSRANEKYENNIQSILLEELESFEGILLATTNNTQNMDSAFDRRFFLKLKIGLPDTEARSKIWHDVFPELAETDVAVLADSYRLTGAQIRNVAEQIIFREALDDAKVSFDEITKMCREMEQNVIGTA